MPNEDRGARCLKSRSAIDGTLQVVRLIIEKLPHHDLSETAANEAEPQELLKVQELLVPRIEYGRVQEYGGDRGDYSQMCQSAACSI